MKRNNNALTAFGLAVAILFVSCNEENLDLQPQFETEASYFNNDREFTEAMIGAYAKLCDVYWFCNNTPNHAIWLLPGDDLTTDTDEGRYSDGWFFFESFVNILPDNGRIEYIWRTYFQLIARSNVILEKIESVQSDPDTEITGEVSVKMKGEALFLRSLAYYKLWNLWGTAPLITRRLKNLGETEQPNSKDTELLDQAITDLTLASTLLPESWPDEYLGRVTRDAAFGLLGKCLVFSADYHFKEDQGKAASDYQAAIVAFNNISSHSLEGVAFEDNFDFAKENNNESLFEFQAGQSPGFERMWRGNDNGTRWDITAMHAYWGFFDCHWTFWDGHPFVPTQKLIAAFEPGDPRFAECMDSTEDTRFHGFMWTKYIKNYGPQTLGGSCNNPRILRYGDILLLKAEAVLQSGGSKADAIALINQVRARARGTDSLIPADLPVNETDQDTIMQWIMDERFRELSGEDDHRWFDLKRWHHAGFIDLSTWDGSDSGFSTTNQNFSFHEFYEDTEGNMWYPIPETEIYRNRNIKQNTGYDLN